MATKQNWVATYGNADIGNGVVTHVPLPQKPSEDIETSGETRKASHHIR